MIDIYTCITGGYDDLKRQPPFKNVRYTAFVEGVQRPVPPWKVFPVPEAVANPDPTRRARKMKVLSHESLPEAEYTLWVDGCFVIRPSFNVERWVEAFFVEGKFELVTFEHPVDDCTYVHADRMLKAGHDHALTIGAQMKRYKEAGFPERSGMVQTNVILRRNTPAVRAFNELWWKEIEAGSRRDQLSFMWAAKESGLRYIALPKLAAGFFEGKSHRGKRTLP